MHRRWKKCYKYNNKKLSSTSNRTKIIFNSKIELNIIFLFFTNKKINYIITFRRIILKNKDALLNTFYLKEENKKWENYL